jgi:hypothetical protein
MRKAALQWKRRMAASSGAAVDAAATALIAAMTGTPDGTRQALIATYIRALKEAGVWQKLDILYLLAAHDAQAASLNWKDPAAFTLALIASGPTFEADRGYTSNGTTQALNTQWTPTVHGVRYILNDASVWAWARTNVAENGADAGNSTNPVTFLRTRSAGDAVAAAINSGTASSGAAAIGTSIGMSGGSRPSSALQRLWRNGVQSGTDGAVASTGLPNQTQYLCARNNDTFSTKQLALGAWGASLTAAEALAFYNSTLAYMQGVGAA